MPQTQRLTQWAFSIDANIPLGSSTETPTLDDADYIDLTGALDSITLPTFQRALIEGAYGGLTSQTLYGALEPQRMEFVLKFVTPAVDSASSREFVGKFFGYLDGNDGQPPGSVFWGVRGRILYSNQEGLTEGGQTGYTTMVDVHRAVKSFAPLVGGVRQTAPESGTFTYAADANDGSGSWDAAGAGISIFYDAPSEVLIRNSVDEFYFQNRILRGRASDEAQEPVTASV